MNKGVKYVIANNKSLLAGYLFLFILLGFAGYSINKNYTQNNILIQKVIDNSTVKLSYLIELRKTADYAQVATLRHIITSDTSSMRLEEELIKDQNNRGNEIFEALGDLIFDPNEQKILNKVLGNRQANAEARAVLLNLSSLERNGPVSSAKFHNNFQRGTYEKYQDAITALSNFIEEDIDIQLAVISAKNEYAKRLLQLIIAAIVSLVLFLGFGIYKTLKEEIVRNGILVENEKKLKSQMEFSGNLIDKSPDGIIGINDQGNIVIFNKHAESLFGYSKNEIKNQSLKVLMIEKNRSLVDVFILNYFGNSDFISMMPKVIIAQRKDSSKFPVELSVNFDFFEDQPIAIASIRDVTGRLKSEKLLVDAEYKLRNIFDNTNNVFFSHDENFKFTYVTPYIKELLGYEPDEIYINKTHIFADNIINTLGKESTLKAIKTGIPQPPYELELIHKNGSIIWVEIKEAPVLNEGKTVSVVGALSDVTERKLHEQI